MPSPSRSPVLRAAPNRSECRILAVEHRPQAEGLGAGGGDALRRAVQDHDVARWRDFARRVVVGVGSRRINREIGTAVAVEVAEADRQPEVVVVGCRARYAAGSSREPLVIQGRSGGIRDQSGGRAVEHVHHAAPVLHPNGAFAPDIEGANAPRGCKRPSADRHRTGVGWLGMGLWGERILPRLVDTALRTPEVNARRALVCAGLQGRVLELGFGSGLNARHYPAAVTEVLAVEPSDLAWQLATAADRRRRDRRDPDRIRRGTTRPRGRLGRQRPCPPTPCAPSLMSRPRCARCVGCSGPGERCTSWSTAAHPTNGCTAGNRESTRCTAGWPGAVTWTGPSTG